MHQHARALTTLLARSVAATYPYRIVDAQHAQPALQFQGGPDRLAFVTLVPPFALAAPIAFTSVVITLDSGERSGLAVRERALPALEPFAESEPVFRDPGVASLSFRYMRAGGGWEDSWDVDTEGALPAAVQITLTPTAAGATGVPPTLTVALRVSGSAR